MNLKKHPGRYESDCGAWTP